MKYRSTMTNKSSSQFVKKFLLFSLLVLAFVSCGDGNQYQSDVGTSSNNSATIKIISKFSDTYDEKSKSSLLEEFKKLVVQKKWAKSGNETEFIVHQFPETEIALFLLSQEFDELISIEKDAEACLFLERYADELKDSKAGRAALSRLLEHEIRNGRTTQFLKLCSKFESAIYGSDFQRIVLHRRIEHQRFITDPLSAARLTFEFSEKYPDHIKRDGLKNYYSGTLVRANLVLEAELLKSGMITGKQLALLSDVGKGPGGKSASAFSTSMNQIYVENASVLTKNLISLESENTADAALFSARMFYFENQREGLQSSIEHVFHYAEILKRTNDMERWNSNTIAVFQGVCDLFANLLSKHAETSAIIDTFDRLDGKRRVGTKEIQRLVGEMAEIETRLLSISGVEDADPHIDLINRYVELLTTVKNYQGVIMLWEGFVNRFPNHERSPQYLFNLGKFYSEKLRTSQLALATIEKLQIEYPNSAAAKNSFLQTAIILYADKNFEAVIDTATKFATAFPKNKRIGPRVKFLHAVSLSEIGDTDRSIEMMEILLRDHPQHMVAPVIYDRLGTHFLSLNDYESARYYFGELSARFPESPEGRSARRILKRLLGIEKRD